MLPAICESEETVECPYPDMNLFIDRNDLGLLFPAFRFERGPFK
jgi:hypothetical protein